MNHFSPEHDDESPKDVQIQCRISYPWPKGGGGLQSLFALLSWRTVGTPYVGMAPKKNGGHIKSAQMTRSKCLR